MIGLALAARVRARHRRERPWEHPAVAGHHEITTSREGAGGEVSIVATCQCTWRSRVDADDLAGQAEAIDGHWRDVIACHEVAA